MANQTIEITTEEYKQLVADSIALTMLRNYAVKEEILLDSQIRSMLGVPRPKRKE